MVGVVGSSPIVPTKIFERGIQVWVPFLFSASSNFDSKQDPLADHWLDDLLEQPHFCIN